MVSQNLLLDVASLDTSYIKHQSRHYLESMEILLWVFGEKKKKNSGDYEKNTRELRVNLCLNHCFHLQLASDRIKYTRTFFKEVLVTAYLITTEAHYRFQDQVSLINRHSRLCHHFGRI